MRHFIPSPLAQRLYLSSMPKSPRHRFAVVDVETTGLVHQDHAITEVAVVHVDERGITPAYHSLVNPEQNIPAAITHLTGLNSSLTSGAPPFSEIAQEVAQALEGRIFVAHQVNFDYAFLTAALAPFGYKPPARRLCSMRLAKRAVPGLTSLRLGHLCTHFGVVNEAPHRALGDAMATAALLQKLTMIESGLHVQAELDRTNRSAVLPSQLSVDDVNELPESPGVYYFYGNRSDRPIYIGKARNVKRRVLSHFSSSGNSRRKQYFQREVARVRVEETASEYAALLLEDAEIKKFFPVYNLAQKQRGKPFAVRRYSNRLGEQRLAILRSVDHPDDLAYFGSAHEARNWILAAMRTFGFHPARAGLSADYEVAPSMPVTSDEAAFSAFLEEAFMQRTSSYLLLEPTQGKEVPFVWVSQGRYRGFGILPGDVHSLPSHVVESAVRPAPESSMVRHVLRNMILDKNITQIEWR